MAEVTIRHEIDCSISDYWDKCVFDNDFNQKLYVERLHFHSFVPSESVDSPERRTKKCTMEPPLTGIPGPAKKVIGDALKYAEDGYLDKKTMRYQSAITPSTFADKTKVSAELWCEPSPTGDANKCVRFARVRVEVKVFVVGSMVEEKIMRDLHESYDAEAAFVGEWVRGKR
jgi:Protein of unknown function (DUF2505)